MDQNDASRHTILLDRTERPAAKGEEALGVRCPPYIRDIVDLLALWTRRPIAGHSLIHSNPDIGHWPVGVAQDSEFGLGWDGVNVVPAPMRPLPHRPIVVEAIYGVIGEHRVWRRGIMHQVVRPAGVTDHIKRDEREQRRACDRLAIAA